MDLTPAEASRMEVRYLDVREAHELEISRLEGAIHLPMGEVPARLGELDPDVHWVIVCRSGMRSHRVAEFLRGQGYGRVSNLVGGINRWAEEVDRSLSRY
jgi:rhodanese-related sulfurtransferase